MPSPRDTDPAWSALLLGGLERAGLPQQRAGDSGARKAAGASVAITEADSGSGAGVGVDVGGTDCHCGAASTGTTPVASTGAAATLISGPSQASRLEHASIEMGEEALSLQQQDGGVSIGDSVGSDGGSDGGCYLVRLPDGTVRSVTLRALAPLFAPALPEPAPAADAAAPAASTAPDGVPAAMVAKAAAANPAAEEAATAATDAAASACDTASPLGTVA